MKKHNLNIFNASGCLTRETVLAWTGRSLSPPDKLLVEEHLAECSLCRDALEGYAHITPDHSRKLLASLDYNMQQQILHSSDKKPLSRRLRLSLAAAVILAFIGIFSLFKFNPVRNNPELGDMQQKYQEISDSTTAVISESPATASVPEIKSTGPVKREMGQDAARLMKSRDQQHQGASRSDRENNASEDLPVVADEVQTEEIIAAVPEEKKEEIETPAAAPSAMQPVSKSVRYSEKALSVERKSNTETTFYVVEENARFEGGDLNKFRLYVEEKLSEGIKSGEVQTGQLTVSFTVGTDGYTRDIFVVKGLDAKTDSLVTAVIKNSPRWKPARHQGKVVNVNVVVPLHLQAN